MERNNQIREHILDQVIACKRENPNEEPQLTRVAAMAGISTRTVNRYFANKETLFYEAALRFMKQKCQEYLLDFTSPDSTGRSGREQVLAFLVRLQRSFTSESIDSLMFVLASNRYLQFQGDRAGATHPFTDAACRYAASLLERGQADGSVKPELDAADTGALICANFNGLMLRLVSDYRSGCTAEVREQTCALFDEYRNMLNLYLRT